MHFGASDLYLIGVFQVDRIEKIDDPERELGFLFRFVTEEGDTVGHYAPTLGTFERLATIAECDLDEILGHSEGILNDLAKVSAQHYFSEYYFSVGRASEALAAANADYCISHPLSM